MFEGIADFLHHAHTIVTAVSAVVGCIIGAIGGKKHERKKHERNKP